jgi:hypothetical protein
MVDLERFRLEGNKLWVSCPKCAAEHGVEGAVSLSSALGSGPMPGGSRVSLVSSPLASNVLTLRTAATEAVQLARGVSDPLAVPEGCCPKCLAKRGAQTSCPQCGLVFERFNPATVEAPGWLLEAWRDLLGDWGSQTRHERLRSEASHRGALSHLGRLYRLRLAWFPDDPWAELGRAEIVRMAEVAVSAGLVDAEPANLQESTPRGRTFAIIGVVLLLGGALAFLGHLLLKTS